MAHTKLLIRIFKEIGCFNKYIEASSICYPDIPVFSRYFYRPIFEFINFSLNWSRTGNRHLWSYLYCQFKDYYDGAPVMVYHKNLLKDPTKMNLLIDIVRKNI